MKLIALILSMPTENATLRQRIWRALKASGAAVLRDGVYLMPEREDYRATLDGLAGEVSGGGGNAYVLRVEALRDANFKALFDRGDDFAGLLAELAQVRQTLMLATVQDVLRQARRLRNAFSRLVEIDFFPGESQKQAESALCELELACARTLSPDEPQAIVGDIPRLQMTDYRGRTWATRRRPWVDRLASAWLIRRFIDPAAHLMWLASPADCPPDALGFDFDGARFSHTHACVTFEVLAASFALQTPALIRLGQLVHFLDVGGVQPLEAAGVESVLAGLRDNIADDDQFLKAASAVFDGLLASFERAAMAVQEANEMIT